MTTVTIPAGRSDELALRVQGHSGFAPAGQDLVCAAASVLAFTLARAAGERSDYHGFVAVDREAAVISVRCRPEKEAWAACRVLFDTVITGFRLLAEAAPEYIQIRSDEHGSECKTDPEP